MGSKTYEGVRFSVFSLDHEPPHVHGSIAGVTVIIDLLGNREARLSDRPRPIIPANAKQNVINRILRVAVANVDELEALWEKIHGRW